MAPVRDGVADDVPRWLRGQVSTDDDVEHYLILRQSGTPQTPATIAGDGRRGQNPRLSGGFNGW